MQIDDDLEFAPAATLEEDLMLDSLARLELLLAVEEIGDVILDGEMRPLITLQDVYDAYRSALG